MKEWLRKVFHTHSWKIIGQVGIREEVSWAPKGDDKFTPIGRLFYLQCRECWKIKQKKYYN